MPPKAPTTGTERVSYGKSTKKRDKHLRMRTTINKAVRAFGEGGFDAYIVVGQIGQRLIGQSSPGLRAWMNSCTKGARHVFNQHRNANVFIRGEQRLIDSMKEDQASCFNSLSTKKLKQLLAAMNFKDVRRVWKQSNNSHSSNRPQVPSHMAGKKGTHIDLGREQKKKAGGGEGNLEEEPLKLLDSESWVSETPTDETNRYFAFDDLMKRGTELFTRSMSIAAIGVVLEWHQKGMV